MRHRNHSNRLSQKPHHSRMIQRNLVTSMLLYEQIRTTKKRAQVIKPLIDNMVTIAKNDRPAVAIRRINQFVTDTNACRKLLEVLKDRFSGRNSGYTKMVPVGMREGDGALLVDLMFVDTAPAAETEKAPAKKAKSAKTIADKAAKKAAPKKATTKKAS